jgi:hypothetical protein
MIRKNIVVSGCSYTENSIWPRLIWPDSRIINLARSGAGNNYIADSIMYRRDPAHSHIFAVDPQNPPDFVYVVFSGINRSDLAVPNCEDTQDFAIQHQFFFSIDDTIYLFSGGHRGKYNPSLIKNYNNIKDPSWPEISGFPDWVKLPLNIRTECLEKNIFSCDVWTLTQQIQGAWNIRYWPNDTFLQTETYKAVIRCLDFLTLHKIKYAFSFFYDVFNPEYETMNSYGCLSRDHPLYHRIDWSKMIKPFPFDLALRHDHILQDGCHQSQDGERLYAQHIQDQLRSML